MPDTVQPDSEQIRARNLATIETYFRLLAALDIDAWTELWAPGCEVLAPYSPGGIPAVVDGRDRLRDVYAGEAAKYTRLDYPGTEILPLHDPRKILARWFPEAELVGGGSYRNENVGIFEFDDDGRIRRFIEYFNPLLLGSGGG